MQSQQLDQAPRHLLDAALAALRGTVSALELLQRSRSKLQRVDRLELARFLLVLLKTGELEPDDLNAAWGQPVRTDLKLRRLLEELLGVSSTRAAS